MWREDSAGPATHYWLLVCLAPFPFFFLLLFGQGEAKNSHLHDKDLTLSEIVKQAREFELERSSLCA